MKQSIYIGESGRCLGDRVRDHFYDIRKNDIFKPVSRHFNSSNHSISNFVVFSLFVINGGKDCRKTKEMRLIHALCTLNPHGINERLTFCKPPVVPEPFCILRFFFLTHLYHFISFCFLHTYLKLRYLYEHVKRKTYLSI